jgi:hypothetical protein
MNPIRLEGKLANGKPCYVWACGECQLARETEQEAEDCCKPKMCECGKPVEFPYTVCKQCREETQRKRDQAIYDKAKKVKWEDYDGSMLVCDRDDKFYTDPGEIFDEHYEDPPVWAWGTYGKKLTIDAHEIVERALENDDACEESMECIPDLTELQKALDSVCAQIPETYWEDKTVVVMFEEEAEEYRKERGE